MSDDGLKAPVVRYRLTSATLLHLQYAVMAAELGSFRRAAGSLRLRQSTLSRCISRLEQTIGVSVFDRFSGGVRTTSAGRNLLHGARSVLAQLDDLLLNARKIGHGKAGRLTIGFYTSLSAGNFRASLIEFRERYPEVEIELIEATRQHLATALRNRVADIAIVIGGDQLAECATVPLWTERIIVAMLKSHPLAKKDAIFWTDLKDEPLLLSRRDPGPELQGLMTSKLVSSTDWPKVTMHDVSRGSLWNLVGAGFGITLLTEATVGTNFVGVVYREIRDVTEPTRIGYSAHWRPENENPALRNFLDLLAERYPVLSATD
jgi:DNA-binding transcriptional LysR family regulator